ncbi:MAG: hypothetical protein H7274_16305 [Rhodoferax sp.]|nr:hypothetical protein [Rhodoferax sp.]
MAFNNIQPAEGPFIIGKGPVRLFIQYPNGDDYGAQWIMANPIGPGALEVSNFAKERRVRVQNGIEVFYWVTVTNIGEDTLFNIQGGGNV